jgi:hypothetical protein
MSDNQEVYNNVLSVTREQLAKSMAIGAELEALLLVERRKVAELERKLAEVENKDEKK